MMRIITGKARGIRLQTLEGDATRPTAERVKEAVFSMIQFDIEGREVLDLFSGSGQLGLEALSRGAAHACLADKSKDAVRIIKANADKTKLAADCDIFNCDYKEFITKNRGRKYDIVFLDPPYAQNLCADALERLIDADMLKSTSIVICETGSDDVFLGDNDLADKFEVLKNNGYGRCYITLLKKKEN